MWLDRLKNLLRNRNSLLVLSLILGLLWGDGAQWIKGVILPIMMILMTVSTLGVTGSTFSSPRSLWTPALVGIGMNYAVLTTFILALNALLVSDPDLRIGFVIIAVVPPAVAVVPFTLFLGGDNQFSLLGMVGAYLSALVIAPALAFALIGPGIISPSKLILIIIELILAPLVLSRILLRVGLDSRLESVEGTHHKLGILSCQLRDCRAEPRDHPVPPPFPPASGFDCRRHYFSSRMDHRKGRETVPCRT